MARLVLHDRNKPYTIESSSGEKFAVCACGLSKNKPLCDGSHKRTLDEVPNAMYAYDENSRVKLTPDGQGKGASPISTLLADFEK
jgi:CDGSH-type Zn-finger protein